MIVWFCQRW